MRSVFEVRREFGSTYFTLFPDGLSIPWHPLPLGDFLSYTRDYSQGIVPPALLEDEIFKKCVTDPAILRRFPFLKAGIVTTVAQNIWEYSGPAGIKDFNEDLDSKRTSLYTDGTTALQDLVQIITMAFPYKPEEVYSMEYEVFLERLVQSEKKLLQLGLITEPVTMTEKGKEKKGLRIKGDPVKFADLNGGERVDAKALWDAQQADKQKPTQAPISTPKSSPDPSHELSTPTGEMSRDRWFKVSPVLEATKKKKIDFKGDEETASMMLLDNDERASPPEVREFLLKKKMEGPGKDLQRDAQWIYKDLLAELAKRKK
jgi:hypothetical protein